MIKPYDPEGNASMDGLEPKAGTGMAGDDPVVIQGSGFNPNGGGFAEIIVNGKSYTPEEVVARLSPASITEAVAWAYYHDGQIDDALHPLLTRTRWPACVEPWTEVPLYAHPLPQGEAGPAACRYCKGSGTTADYVGDEMRCVEVECPWCKGRPLVETGDTDELVERYAAQVRVARAYAIDAAKGTPTSTFEITVQHFAGFESEFASRLTSLRAERDAAEQRFIEWWKRTEAAESSLAAEKQRVVELTEITQRQSASMAEATVSCAKRGCSSMQRNRDEYLARAEAAEQRVAALEGALMSENAAIAEYLRYCAGNYPESSDGRNTFVMAASWVEARTALAPVTTPPAETGE